MAVLSGTGVSATDRVLVDLSADWPIAVDCQRALAELGVAVSEDVARFQPSVLITTPSSALRLEQAESLRIVMVTGEPGGSIGACRRLIEGRGGARCVDVYALHELGVVGWSCPEQSDCLHLDDHALRLDVLEADSEHGVRTGDLGELVVSLSEDPTNRLRTGDLVRLSRAECACRLSSAWAVGGVLGRVSERLRVRGCDLLPSTVEQVVRRHPGVGDFRLRVYRRRGSDSAVAVELEPQDMIATEGDRSRVAAEVSQDLRRSLGLRLAVDVVPPGSIDHDAYGRVRRVIRA